MLISKFHEFITRSAVFVLCMWVKAEGEGGQAPEKRMSRASCSQLIKLNFHYILFNMQNYSWVEVVGGAVKLPVRWNAISLSLEAVTKCLEEIKVTWGLQFVLSSTQPSTLEMKSVLWLQKSSKIHDKSDEWVDINRRLPHTFQHFNQRLLL